MTTGGSAAMSTIRASSQAAGAAWRSPVRRRAARSARWARAYCLGGRRRAAWIAMVSAGTVLLAAACGGSPGSAASPSRLYQQSLTYSRCMRSHGVPDFPILKQGPGGSLVHPVSPPAGMLAAPGYDAAFQACLQLAVIGGGAQRRVPTDGLHEPRQDRSESAHHNIH